MLMRRLRGMMMRTMPLMITCQEVEDFIEDYLEATLPQQQRRIFNLHLRLCPDCRSYLDKYEKAIALGRSAFKHPDRPIPEDVPDELLKAILAARDEKA